MNKTAKNIILRIIMFIGLSAFIFLIVMAKINRDATRVKKIKISIDEWNGIFFVSKTQLFTFIVNNFDVKDKILSGRELERIENAVNRIPQVKRSNAFTDNQGYLNIKIEQRKPMLRVYNLYGQSFYIDEEGNKFPTTDSFTAKVPAVTGNITEVYDSIKRIQSPELKRIYNVVSQINKNALWRAMIGQYNINEKGLVELLPRFGSATILFGDEVNSDQKLKHLDVFYFDVLPKIGWDYYKVINIMYKDQVVCLK